MRLYAHTSARRTRQQIGDLLALTWVVGWLWLAHVVHEATLALAGPGRTFESAGTGLADRLREAGGAVGGLPLVGDSARRPLDEAGRAADQIADAGTAQVAAVQHLAFWLAVVVAALPILVLVAVYLPRRWRFARTATAGQRLVDADADLALFALRAVVHQPLHRLAGVSHDPVAALRTGDAQVVRALATLELTDAGLRPPVESGRVPGTARG
jgi:hypothetical protein